MKSMLSSLKNRRKIIISLIILLSIVFILLHLTPKMSVKTWLFFHGHIEGALLSNELDFNELETQLGLSNGYLNEDEEVYIINNSNIKYWATGNTLYSVKVKKHAFLYFAEYYCHEG